MSNQEAVSAERKYENERLKKPAYRVWAGMKNRCTNPNAEMFPFYGGRGIRVCEEWAASYDAFMRDMGPRPSRNHSIDRIDTNGDYCPENCRWVTNAEQQRNRTDNRFITHANETRCLQEWGEVTGLKPNSIRYRIEHGWTVEEALFTPIHPPC